MHARFNPDDEGYWRWVSDQAEAMADQASTPEMRAKLNALAAAAQDFLSDAPSVPVTPPE